MHVAMLADKVGMSPSSWTVFTKAWLYANKGSNDESCKEDKYAMLSISSAAAAAAICSVTVSNNNGH